MAVIIHPQWLRTARFVFLNRKRWSALRSQAEKQRTTAFHIICFPLRSTPSSLQCIHFSKTVNSDKVIKKKEYLIPKIFVCECKSIERRIKNGAIFSLDQTMEGRKDRLQAQLFVWLLIKSVSYEQVIVFSSCTYSCSKSVYDCWQHLTVYNCLKHVVVMSIIWLFLSICSSLKVTQLSKAISK